MAVLENLLPGKKYAKFVKFFAGIVLILLVLQPLAGSAQLEEVVARYYEAFVFQNQADDLKREILGVEKQRLEQIFRQYEQAIEADVSLMAADAGFTAEECQVVISRDEGTEAFGTVERIALRVRWEEPERRPMERGISEQAQTERNTQEQIEKRILETVQIETVDLGRGPESTVREQEEEISRQALRRQQEEARTAAGKLRRKIAAYYNLEDSYVEIQIVERER